MTYSPPPPQPPSLLERCSSRSRRGCTPCVSPVCGDRRRPVFRRRPAQSGRRAAPWCGQSIRCHRCHGHCGRRRGGDDARSDERALAGTGVVLHGRWTRYRARCRLRLDTPAGAATLPAQAAPSHQHSDAGGSQRVAAPRQPAETANEQRCWSFPWPTPGWAYASAQAGKNVTARDRDRVRYRPVMDRSRRVNPS